MEIDLKSRQITKLIGIDEIFNHANVPVKEFILRSKFIPKKGLVFLSSSDYGKAKLGLLNSNNLEIEWDTELLGKWRIGEIQTDGNYLTVHDEENNIYVFNKE
jgi:hypothetical protein